MPSAVEPPPVAIMLQANSATVLGSGWHPPMTPRSLAQTALADTIRRSLPANRHLLWNVRNDLPPVAFAELLAQRIRAIGSARMWRIAAELETLLASARNELC